MRRPAWLRVPGRRRKGAGLRPRPWRSFLAAFWPFILGSVLVAGGLAAIVLGYLGVAGTVHVGLQLPYLASGALLGLALVVLGSALLVLHGLAGQTRLLRRLLEQRASGADTGVASAPQTDGVVLVPRGAKRFHRPGCLLVEGKEVRRLKSITAVRRGLEPCEVCDPALPDRV
jgi:hypothetical protein